ncbi:transposase [Microbacterium sp. MYb40]|uniref:transposase n=1 Tax=unclassified Microbacterium TaxID=2609290 RepID=UPI0035BE8556
MLSDAQWSFIEPMLPARTGRRGRPFSDARSMVEAIVYRYRTGIAWRDLLRCSARGKRCGPGIAGWRWRARGRRCMLD